MAFLLRGLPVRVPVVVPWGRIKLHLMRRASDGALLLAMKEVHNKLFDSPKTLAAGQAAGLQGCGGECCMCMQHTALAHLPLAPLRR